MNKGYKECPFCGEKIKEIAKKCRFCGEFLEGENDNSSSEKKEEKITVKNYGFWGRFFRKDLNLNKKWWHRLIKIIFFICIVGLPLYNVFYDIREMKNSYRMEYIDTIENRILNDDIVQIGSLLNYNEHIEQYSTRNDSDGPKLGSLTQYNEINVEHYYKSMYCSKKWNESKLDKIAKETNLWYRSLADMRIGNPSLKQVNDEIQEYKCVLEDKIINGEKILNHQAAKLDELYIVKRTVKSKIRAFLWWCGFYLLFQAFILIPGCVLIIIYYKIIIYIIYGSYKKNKS